MAAISKRARKRHVQQSLFRRGGKRRGAGRKPIGARAGARHAARRDFTSTQPVHVVLRVVAAVGSLRRRSMYKAIREASLTALVRERFRITHISVQRTHLHMLVEANDKAALGRGMQGFQISVARNINTVLGSERAGGSSRRVTARPCGVAPSRWARRRRPRRRGKVFADRYHVEVIETPTQARHSLRYLLGNWRHHGEDRAAHTRGWRIDPFSTAILFPGWLELEDRHFLWPMPPDYEPLFVVRPRTWLLSEGWKRTGVISVHDVPGPARR